MRYRFSYIRFCKISLYLKFVRLKNNWKEVFENIFFIKEKNLLKMIYYLLNKIVYIKKKKVEKGILNINCEIYF